MGKTITTYLIDDTPQGVQYVIIGNKSCKMYVVPRASLISIKDREELRRPALYILLGEDIEGLPKAYIGESENVYERLKNHGDGKNFWLRALVFIASDNLLDKADVRYLEHLAIAVSHEAKRYSIDENKTKPGAPNLSEHKQATIEEFFGDIKMLASFIGCSIFEVAEQKSSHLFYLKQRGCNAKGGYDENGFTVFEGSIIAKNVVPSFRWNKKREQVINEVVSIDANDNFVLESSYTFSSPSTAAGFCTGGNLNGWIEWKDKNGHTLDEVYRKQLK